MAKIKVTFTMTSTYVKNITDEDLVDEDGAPTDLDALGDWLEQGNGSIVVALAEDPVWMDTDPGSIEVFDIQRLED